jgi:nicotinamide-nucleotide amidase
MKEIMGVSKDTLEKYGAVSKNTAQEMSLATLAFTNSDICLSITGVAGPLGGSYKKPVGTVYFSYSDKYGSNIVKKIIFKGSRKEIRYLAAKEGIQIILDCATDIKTQ